MAENPAKRLKSAKDAPYKLVYWPGLPGRGEHVRLAFEEAGVAYTDTAQTKDAIANVQALIGTDNIGDGANVPPFAPPILVHGDLTISQTPNILLYLGPRLGLVPPSSSSDENSGDNTNNDELYRINALVLTALDGLSNEVHDCHHPVSTGLYYEDQKAEALRRSQDFVASRLPKFLAYFERVLAGRAAAAAEKKSSGGGSSSSSSSNGPYFYGATVSYADLVLFHCLDGTQHQFTRAVHAARDSGAYARVFALYDAVRARPRIAAYLASERRLKYGNGIYRHYKELDVLPPKEEK
ncbi:Glutathione S-transferase protein [Niveomyces insectorum RCEF 264]|uniref:Glutathione S-transferase protein n=1 Tax=Niveomyces insectorum RCEF 264 TaxID=1081102 RepID=A0A167XZE8_9HYPO|nr:Glutathione S-transferase protein [Niveomyces insectorum RCEF 264]